MSYIKNNINFTPFHPRQINQLGNNYTYSRSQANFNNKLNSFSNNNFNFNASKIISNDQETSSFSNNISNNYNTYNNNYMYDEQNEYAPCFISVNGLDEYSKDIFFNFLENQQISPRNYKVLDKKRIIIQFSDQKSRIKFTEEYNNVKQNFIGVELKFISEAEKDRLINNNANRMSFGNSFFNNYRNNSNNMIQMPKKKSNYQKFWDVFLNL